MHGGAAIVCMCSGVEGAASGLNALAATLNEAAFLVVHECRLVYLDADMILLKHTGGLGTGMEGRAGGRAGERAGGGGVGTHILITFSAWRRDSLGIQRTPLLILHLSIQTQLPCSLAGCLHRALLQTTCSSCRPGSMPWATATAAASLVSHVAWMHSTCTTVGDPPAVRQRPAGSRAMLLLRRAGNHAGLSGAQHSCLWFPPL